MSQTLIQRIIGGIVLLLVAGFIIMLILSGQKTKSAPSTIKLSIPETHEAEETITVKPKENLQTVITRLNHRENEAVASPKIKPKVKSTVVSVKKTVQHKLPPIHKISKKEIDAWVVQVASFSQHQSAKELAKKIATMGYKTFVEKSRLAKRKLIYRVFVGPLKHERQAKKIQKQLHVKIHLQGLVFKHKVMG